MTRQLWSFPGGIHPPMHKAASTREAIAKIHLPKRLVLPLHQHIGEASKVLVDIGDPVQKGQLIAAANGYISVPLHAPTSGRIVAIEDHVVPHPSGLTAPCIILESDGQDEWAPRPTHPDFRDMAPSHLRNLVREAGIVGLGGAGFPAFIKLNPGANGSIDTLILNGVECEPYITCDDMLMRERPEEIIAGMFIMRHALQAKNVVIALEDNKPEAARILGDALKRSGATNAELVVLPTIYPQGSEKQLIQVLTGKEVPSDGLPLHIGVVVQNVATAAAVFRAMQRGEPLVSRIVTVTGSGVRNPRNVEVLIGTPMSEIIAACDGPTPDTKRLIMGGPMMGFALNSAAAPVVKTTNCLLVATDADLPQNKQTMPCIRCGICADVCPASLLPQQLYWFAKGKDFEKAQEHHLFDCIECGCCAYACPSNIPLVHYYRYAKTEIWGLERDKEKADLARRRHDFRLERLEREKAERASRHRQKRDALQDTTPPPSDTGKTDKNPAILAALERAKAKKARQQAAGPNSDDNPSGSENSQES